MIDHLAIYTTDETHKKTVEFYTRILEPLGYKKEMEFMDGKVVGFGDGKSGPDFWIGSAPTGEPRKATASNHFAFSAKDHKTVDAVYAKAIEAGAKDNGPPGLRTNYHPSYYAGFMYDPVGNAIEVVNHHEG